MTPASQDRALREEAGQLPPKSHFRHSILGVKLGVSREAPYPNVEVTLCVSSTDLKGIVGTRVDRGSLDLKHVSRHTSL